MAESYGWYCNNNLHGSPNKDEDHKRFQAHRDKARSLLQHNCCGAVAHREDAIFDKMEDMIREACWACAQCRWRKQNHDDGKAVAAKGVFCDLLENASNSQEWPLY